MEVIVISQQHSTVILTEKSFPFPFTRVWFGGICFSLFLYFLFFTFIFFDRHHVLPCGDLQPRITVSALYIAMLSANKMKWNEINPSPVCKGHPLSIVIVYRAIHGTVRKHPTLCVHVFCFTELPTSHLEGAFGRLRPFHAFNSSYSIYIRCRWTSVVSWRCLNTLEHKITSARSLAEFRYANWTQLCFNPVTPTAAIWVQL